MEVDSSATPPYLLAALESLFEDIHWIVLVAGYVLCIDSQGEVPCLPEEIKKYCEEHSRTGRFQLQGTVNYLTGVNSTTVDESGAESCDHAFRIFADVLRLCALEKSAAEANLGYFMSPELGSTLVWFLNKWCLTYLEFKDDRVSATNFLSSLICNLHLPILGKISRTIVNQTHCCSKKHLSIFM